MMTVRRRLRILRKPSPSRTLSAPSSPSLVTNADAEVFTSKRLQHNPLLLQTWHKRLRTAFLVLASASVVTAQVLGNNCRASSSQIHPCVK